MVRKSRTGLAGLLLRQAGSARGASAIVVVIVLIVSGLLAAWPRAIDHTFSDDLRRTVADVAPSLRNVQITTTGTTMLPGQSSDPGRYGWNSAIDDVWGTTADRISHIRHSAPLPLRRSLGRPAYIASTDVYGIEQTAIHADLSIRFNADPGFRSRAHIVHGRWPKQYTGDLTQPRRTPIEVALSTTTAKQLGWTIGHHRTIGLRTTSGSRPVRVRLVGEFRADDPDAGFWSTYTGKLYPEIHEPPNGPKSIEGAAFVNAAGWGAFTENVPGLTLQAGIPLKTGTLQISDAATGAAQLRSFTSQTFKQPAPSQYQEPTQRSLSTESDDAIDAVVARAASTNRVLALLASAPVGVAVAVLALASEMFIERRRPTLALMAARGASGLQRRGAVAVEGLALGMPASILSVISVSLLIPAHTPVTVLPFLVGLLPAAFFAWTANIGSLRRQRTDLPIASRGRARWIAEVIVLVATAVAVYLVRRQGAGGDTALGVDPLVAAAPLLIALSVCVITLRLYPAPMLIVTTWLRRSRGLIGFLGSARSVRESGTAFIPALVLIVGFGTATYSGIVLSTIHDGISDAARQHVGADVQVNGPLFTTEKLRAVRKLSDIKTAVAVADEGQVSTSTSGGGSETDTAQLIVADLAALPGVQQSVPGAVRVPPSTDRDAAGTIPVIAGTAVTTKQTQVSFGPGRQATVDYVRVRAHAFGIADGGNWILMDTNNYERAVGRHKIFPTQLLVSAMPGVSNRSMARQLRDLLGPNATYETPEDDIASINDQPSTRGLQIGLEASLILSALLSATVIAMTLVVGAPSRERLGAILRSYGVSKRQSGMLVWWEIGPIIVAATIAGAVLGWLLPVFVTDVVDFRPFTHGVMRPSLSFDPLVMGSVFAAFIVVVAVAAIIAIRIAGRVAPATVLRNLEEG